MVGDDLGRPGGRERVVAHLRLGIDQADQVARLALHPADGQHRQVQHLEHRLVLGPADDAAIDGGGLDPGRLGQEMRQPAGAGDGVRVGVVVGHHQRAAVPLGRDQQLAKLFAHREMLGMVGGPLWNMRRKGVAHGIGAEP